MQRSRAGAGWFPGLRRFLREHAPSSPAAGALAWPALAVALIPPFEYFQRGLYGNEVATAIVSLILLAGTCAACFLARSGGWAPGGGAAARWLAAVLAAAGVSAAANGAFLEGLPAVSVTLAGVAGFLLLSGWGKRVGAGRALAAGLAAGGALAGLYGVAQAQGGIEVSAAALADLRTRVPGLAEQVAARIAEGRAFAFFLYPSALAGYLILALPFGVAGWMEGSRWRWAWGGAAALAAAGLVASGSIGAAAALALAIVAVEIASRSRRVVPVVGALVLFAAILAWRGPGALGSGMAVKLAHWRTMAGLAPSTLSLAAGRGPGSYGAAASAALPPAIWSRYAHDWPLETWIEQGLVGLVPLLGFLAVGLFAWRRMTCGRPDVWRSALAVAWLAGLVHVLTDFDYVLPAVSFPWWCLTGWLVAVSPGSPGAPALERAWRWLTGVASALRKRGLPFLLPVLVLPLILLKGTSAVLWESAVLGIAVAAFWGARCLGGLRPVVGRADLPWIGLLVLAAGWALFSSRPDASYTALLVTAGVFAAVLLVRALARVSLRVESSMRASVLGATIVIGGWGIVESVMRHLPAMAGFPSPNFLGAFLVFGGGLALGSIGKGGLLPAGALAIAVAGIAATRSAGAGLAACAVAGGWLAVEMVRTHGHRRLVAFASLAMVIMVAAWGTSRIEALSLVQRLAMWREATHLIVLAPEGWGPRSYADAVLRVQEPSITVAGVGRYSLVAQFAHCEPLQFAAEWGVAGLGLLLWGLVLAWLAAGRGPASAWRLALGGVLIHGLVDFPLRAPPILMLAATAIAFMAMGGRSSGGAKAPRVSPAGAALCAVLACWLGVQWVRPAVSRSSREHEATLSRPPSFWRNRALAAWPMRAAEEPPKPGLVLDSGSEQRNGMLRLDRLDRDAAGRFFREELAREPFRLDAHVGLGDLARARGDFAEARSWYRKALLLRSCMVRRPGLNDYERALIQPGPAFERAVRRRLLDLGGER
ncbi:MAG: hypothetical protein AAB152_09290 [Candidatus Coatesbacteria bacterium]